MPKRSSESYRLGVLHGLVFGDGSWNKQEVRSGEHLHYVQLYGEKVARFKDFFDQLNFSPCLDVHPGYVGTGVVRAPVNLKRALPETGDGEYIAGFVDGSVGVVVQAVTGGESAGNFREGSRAVGAAPQAAADRAGQNDLIGHRAADGGGDDRQKLRAGKFRRGHDGPACAGIGGPEYADGPAHRSVGSSGVYVESSLGSVRVVVWPNTTSLPR